jgi:hypothetical protein
MTRITYLSRLGTNLKTLFGGLHAVLDVGVANVPKQRQHRSLEAIVMVILAYKSDTRKAFCSFNFNVKKMRTLI